MIKEVLAGNEYCYDEKAGLEADDLLGNNITIPAKKTGWMWRLSRGIRDTLQACTQNMCKNQDSKDEAGPDRDRGLLMLRM